MSDSHVQQVRELAYAIWQEEGCRHGNDLAHWFQAEADIAAETAGIDARFEDDIRQHVMANLPHRPNDVAPLAAKTPVELLIIYANWLGRLVHPTARRVHCSTVLQRNPLAADPAYRPALEQIIANLEAGNDITAYLSRGIQYAFQAPDPTAPRDLRRRRDLDLLLNDWRVYHLHLSTVLEPDGFVARTGPLLFVAFKRDDAYLIDIVSHGEWTRERVLEIMVREWPNAALLSELRGVIGLERPVSEEDRKLLRSNAINSFIEIDGKVYSPLGGMTTAGTSIQATMGAQQVFRILRWFAKRLADDPDYVPSMLKAHGIEPPLKPDLRFVFFSEGGYGVVELKSGFRFRLGN